jgi:hypothetical protein
MSIIASKTCAAKSAAKIQPIFELHNTFTTLFFIFYPDKVIKSRCDAQKRATLF